MRRNPIGDQLNDAIETVFCDLHNEKQVEDLAGATGLSAGQIFEKLFVVDHRRQKGERAVGEVPPSGLGEAYEDEYLVDLSPIDREFADLLRGQSNGDQTAVLVGSVGSGKTSFLHRFARYVAPENPSLDKFAFLHLNFTDHETKGRYNRAATRAAAFDSVVNWVLQDYYNRYVGGLPDLAELFAQRYIDEGIQRRIDRVTKRKQEVEKNNYYLQWAADLGIFNCERIRYLAKRTGKRVVICVDNVDMWPLDDQIELLSIALEQATWYGAGVLLVVRPEPLAEVRPRLPLLQQNIPLQMRLAPQRVDLVVRRRLRLLENVLGGAAPGPYGVESPRLEARWRFRDADQLVTLLGRVAQALTTGETYEFLRALTNHNIRLMFYFVRRYICSPNTDMWRFLQGAVLPTEGAITSSLWEHGSLHAAITVAALGDGPFCHPSETMLCNVFCNESRIAPYDALVRVRVLDFVCQRESTSRQSMIHGLASAGYDVVEVENATSALVRDYLLESKSAASDGHQVLLVTAAGKYYNDTLLYRLAYVQHMRDASFLPGAELPIGNRTNLEDRLWNTAKFVQFLDTEEQGEWERGNRADSEAYAIYCGDGLTAPRIAGGLLTEVLKIGVREDRKGRETIKILRQVAERESGSGS
jgi:hypothetical protein